MELGFSAAIETLARHTGTIRSAPSFGRALPRLRRGFCTLWLLYASLRYEAELDAAARALEEDMSQENLDRFQAAQQQKLDVESRRRDLDLADTEHLFKS